MANLQESKHLLRNLVISKNSAKKLYILKSPQLQS